MLFVSLLGFFSILTREDEPAYGIIEGIEGQSPRDFTFINQHKISLSNYQTSGDVRPFTNAITETLDNTYWVGSIETTETEKNIVEFEFDDLEIVGSIILYSAYRTRDPLRHFDGFPTILNIHSKVDNANPYELKYTVNNKPSYPYSSKENYESVQIEFPRRIICKKLKLEFVDVTIAESLGSNKKLAGLRQIYVLRNTTVDPYFPVQKATGIYDDGNSYLQNNNNRIWSENCTTLIAPDSLSSYPFSNVFKYNNDHWCGSTPNTLTFKNSIIYEMPSLTSIEALVYFPAFATDRSVNPYTRRYDGYPIVLNIYTSMVGDSYKLQYVHYGIPETHASTEAELLKSFCLQFPKPLHFYKLKLEFEELTPCQSFNMGSKLVPSAKYIFLMKVPQNEENPEPPELPRIDENNTDDSHEIVEFPTIEKVNFTDIHSVDKGGAVHLIDYKVNFSDTTFTRCSADIAGGAIYFNTKLENIHENHFEKLTFNDCHSGYGGALCAIAAFDEDYISIIDCIFNSNSADDQGSAIFLVAKNGQVKACKFTQNTGSSIIKYAANEPSSTARILTSSNLVISDCSFEEDIKEGSFYIDVDETFDSKGISLKDNKFKSNDTQQAIKINQSPVKQETKSKSSLLLTILVPTLCVISLLLIIFIIVVHKNKDQQSEQEENHNEELTQDEV